MVRCKFTERQVVSIQVVITSRYRQLISAMCLHTQCDEDQSADRVVPPLLATFGHFYPEGTLVMGNGSSPYLPPTIQRVFSSDDVDIAQGICSTAAAAESPRFAGRNLDMGTTYVLKVKESM